MMYLTAVDHWALFVSETMIWDFFFQKNANKILFCKNAFLI